ncbi:MAG: WecB/TagA/CpsF family glycosyltransferase [Clostridia bacterium]|nr:WecB/TagA/CpsF family glycosyltransferase [Clostridia bacterium]
MKQQIMTIQFDDVTMEEAVTFAMDSIRRGERCRVVTPNAEFALEAKNNPRFLNILNDSELVLADGISVIYASRIVGKPLHGRVTGVGFAQALTAELAKAGKRLYLLGAKPGVAEQAARRLLECYPGLVIAGTHDGYFREEAPVVEAINAAHPDALFVCLGAPKQEYFMEEHGGELNVPVMAGLGGSMDVLAGNVKRAPAFFQKAGIEWLYRLCKEPKRWRRMAKLPLYLWDALMWKGKGAN